MNLKNKYETFDLVVRQFTQSVVLCHSCVTEISNGQICLYLGMSAHRGYIPWTGVTYLEWGYLPWSGGTPIPGWRGGGTTLDRLCCRQEFLVCTSKHFGKIFQDLQVKVKETGDLNNFNLKIYQLPFVFAI